MRVLFIHGRGQGGKDPDNLKDLWIATLEKGLSAAGATLPPGVRFDFPFYGDALDGYTTASELPTPDDVAAKGAGQSAGFESFMQSVLTDMLEHSPDLTEQDVENEMQPGQPTPKDPQNWWWVRAIARAIDKKWPSAANSVISRYIKDVYLYVTAPAVTKGINAIVERELTNEPTVVVGHSLGSVVGYNIVKKHHGARNFVKYVTVGSPLGLSSISAKLGVPENPTHKGWYNARDPKDVVALFPLDEENFDTDPDIDNYSGVANHTDNHHGIIGYLDDPKVAGVIAASLMTAAGA